MALEKEDGWLLRKKILEGFSVVWEFRVTGDWVAARVASWLEMGLQIRVE